VSILVIAPSRGRPGAAQMLWTSMQNTVRALDTRLLIVADADDPEVGKYLHLPETGAAKRFGFDIDRLLIRVLTGNDTGDMTTAMNTAAKAFYDRPHAIIGMVNDDHRFLTPGWDLRVEDALREPGIAYGDDLFQGERLVAGGVFMNAVIPRALGWYCLPSCRHLFVDNVWTELGKHLGLLRYQPDVVIEHLHPFAGKGTWDEGYERANNQAAIDADRVAYEEWRDRGGLVTDAARVREALRMAA